jgi:hypothetical protein
MPDDVAHGLADGEHEGIGGTAMQIARLAHGFYKCARDRNHAGVAGQR